MENTTPTNQMPNINPLNTQMQNNNQSVNKNLLIICATIIVVCLIITGGLLYSKTISAPVANNNNPQPQNNQPTGPVKVSMDDDAVLGNASAPVTMIEFSDYECPFCKRHFTDVFPQIKKDYIDTGKVKMVFRDLIAVTAHNPLATSEALAAQCAKEQGGDAMYFKYHDALYTKTTSNGNGLLLSDLPAMAKNLGLNVAAFQQCLDSQKYKDEIAKDQADGAKVGVNGTPSFFVGKSSPDGVINGTIIVGAQPYVAFKAAFDQALAGK